MGGKWRLANGRKPKGALDRAEKFLPGPAEISACSVSVPVEMDKREAVEAAGGLAGPGVRSYEVWWDGSEKQLQMVLACEKADMAGYRQAFRNMPARRTLSWRAGCSCSATARSGTGATGQS